MFKALKSFSGKVSMAKGQKKDIQDKEVIKDLLNAGYIEEIKEEVKNEIKKEVKKVEKVIDEIKTKNKKSK